MHIAITGAGIGGLCAAAGLTRAGAQVTVFERGGEVRSGGSGLTVFGNGLRALDAIGIGDRFREITAASAATFRGGIRRPDGRWLSTYPAASLAGLRVVDRSLLHQILVAAAGAGSLRPGRRVVRAGADGRVDWQDSAGAEHTEQFDLVVAADGIRSAVRAGLPGDPGVTSAGYSAWRGITARTVELGGEAGETWGVDRRFGVAPLADGRVYWFAVHGTARARPDADGLTLDAAFAGWHAPIAELIAATPASGVQHLPIEELARPLPTFVRGRVVLLGDAAHAMTPNLGQGGGQAMEDAATLSALLAPLAAQDHPAPDAVDAALARYDALRRPRTGRIARRSRDIGRIAHVRSRSLAGLRDAILRATPESALRRQLDGIQRWAPPNAS